MIKKSDSFRAAFSIPSGKPAREPGRWSEASQPIEVEGVSERTEQRK